MGNKFGSLLSLGPANNDQWVALRMALGIFLPLFGLLALDRLDLMVFVIFGAFTGVYGRVQGYGNRLAAQTKAGTLFLVVIGAAALASRYLVNHDEIIAGTWMVVGLTTLVSGICSVITGYLQLRPAGSLFHIFAFAAIASMAHQPPPLESLIAALVAVLFSVVLGFSGIIFTKGATWGPFTARTPLSRPVRMAIWNEAWLYMLAAGLAGFTANLLAPALSTGHSYWAMVAAVVPLVGHTTRHRVRRGVHRILGTLTGLLAMAAVIAMDPPVWALLAMIGLLQFGAEMFIARNYFLGQIFVTPLALMGVSVGSGLDTALLYDRMLETVIGAVIGMLVVLIGSVYGTWLRRRLLPVNPEASGQPM